jgi:hypothetical protein
MNNINYPDLMMDAISELAEEERADHTPPVPGLPDLRSVLADASPLPREAAFLGLAEDGLPVLLNLYDSIPGPILVSGDQACGKTRLLQTVARAAEFTHLSSDVQFSILTPHPNEWDGFQGSQHNTGIYAAQDSAINGFLQSLVDWAHNNKDNQQSILLLVDDIEALINTGQQTSQNLRWLLLRGPSRHVWPIVTVNAGRAKNIEVWLNFFRTRLFGRTSDINDASLLTGDPNKSLSELTAGSEFTLREGSNWLNLWVPAGV